MFERPSDILDAAADLTQRETDARIAEHLARVEAQKLKVTGLCYNCEEELETGLIFCDVDCREDYEKRVRR
jgi:hypothetical protein